MITRVQPPKKGEKRGYMFAATIAVMSIMLLIAPFFISYGGDSPYPYDSYIPYYYDDVYIPYYQEIVPYGSYGGDSPYLDDYYSPGVYDYGIYTQYSYQPIHYYNHVEDSLYPWGSRLPSSTPLPLGSRIYRGCNICIHESDCAFICKYYSYCVNISTLQGTWVEVGDNDFLTTIKFNGVSFRAYGYVEAKVIEVEFVSEDLRVTAYGLEKVQPLSNMLWFDKYWMSIELVGWCQWAMPTPSCPGPFILRVVYSGFLSITNEGQLELALSQNYRHCRPYDLYVFNYWFDDGNLVICNGVDTMTFARM